MITRASVNRHFLASHAFIFLLVSLLLLPSIAAFGRPIQSQAISQTVSSKKTAPPSAVTLENLKVGDLIRARSLVTGKVEWKQVTHSTRRTVPALLSIQLANAHSGRQSQTFNCPLDEGIRLSTGKNIPAARLAVGNSIVTRAGPICKVKALWLLKRPGGFILSDIRVGTISATQSKQLALLQNEQNSRSLNHSVASLANPAGTPNGTLNPFLFQGQQYDPASSDYYLRARYYDPTLGRFLSQDPSIGSDIDPVSLHR